MALPLDLAWKRRAQLSAEGNRLRAEGKKLRVEGKKLCAESDKVWAEAIIEAHGNISIMWEGTDCVLSTGERFSMEDV